MNWEHESSTDGTLLEQVLDEFVEGSEFGRGIVEQGMRVIHIRNRDRERKTAKRPAPATVCRVCPECGNEFQASVHGDAGRTKIYDDEKCARKARNRRYRQGGGPSRDAFASTHIQEVELCSQDGEQETCIDPMTHPRAIHGKQTLGDVLVARTAEHTLDRVVA